ncbi:MAG: response regulator [Thermincola sp.]|nr:response regulator [Thermincola sp.]MDT3702384.1 response regulator [Thermincola sp.]
MNILIVDDERDSLEEIGHYVDKYAGCRTYVLCSNALEAMAQAAKIPFDIALLDIEMPGIHGLELAKKLTNLYPWVGIAFITAYNHFAAEAFEVNAVDYILKPIREDRLCKALDKLKVQRLAQLHTEERPGGISIQMFDKFIVRIGDQLFKWTRQKSSELFAYLLQNKEYPVHKEKLCELLWPGLEPKKSLVNLQTAMYSVRKLLKADEGCRIRIEYVGSHYTLHMEEALTDVDKFEGLLQKAAASNDAAVLKQAVNLYAGDYLEKEGWLWAEPKKVALRKKYMFAIQRAKGK